MNYIIGGSISLLVKGDKECVCVCKELRMDFQEWESCPYELSYRFGIDSVTGKKVGD